LTWSFCVILISFSGCLYQCYYISNNYFEHEVVSDVEIRFSETIEPPSITVCFDLVIELKLNVRMPVMINFVVAWPWINLSNQSFLDLPSKNCSNWCQAQFKQLIASFELEFQKLFSIKTFRKLSFDLREGKNFATPYKITVKINMQCSIFYRK